MSELGERLKIAREEKNISLEEIQETTKIQKRYLQAIEEGRFHQLPGSFYTKAFIKSYAEAVGLNAEALFAEYKDELPEVSQTIESLPPRRSRTIVSSKKGKFLKVLPSLLAFVLIIGILAVIWMMAINNNSGSPSMNVDGNDENVEFESNEDVVNENDGEGDESRDETEEDIAAEENLEQDEDEKGQPEFENKGWLELIERSGDRSNYALKGTDQFNVVFAFTGDSWLKIEGKSGKMYVNEGFSNGDEVSFDFSDEESVRIRIGSTPNINVVVNGESIPLQKDIVTQTVIITNE